MSLDAKKILKFFSGLNALLVFVPIAYLGQYFGLAGHWIFVCAAIGIVPLAGLMGEATEHLSERSGPGIGGLLNATFGNAAELIIALVALRAGQVDVVRASLTGSIIGNILFVLGLAIFVGGFRREKQTFNATAAGIGTSTLTLAVVAMMIPSLLHTLPSSYFLTDRVAAEVRKHDSEPASDPKVGALPSAENKADEKKGAEKRATDSHDSTHGIERSSGLTKPFPSFRSLSVLLAIVLLIMYAASLWFSLKTHAHLYNDGEEKADAPHGAAAHPEPDDIFEIEEQWSLKRCIAVLLIATFFVAVVSEVLIHALEEAVKTFGFTESFVGLFIVAVVGNAAEHSTAVVMAMKDRMNLAFTIAVESSKQIALFVAPFLVLASLFLSKPGDAPMTLEFTLLEIVAVWASTLALSLISHDGESNWFEGLQLLSLYTILGITFYYIP